MLKNIVMECKADITFHKNHNKNNNKKQSRITKAFEKLFLSETILSIK